MSATEDPGPPLSPAVTGPGLAATAPAPGILVLTVTGELDLGTVPALDEALDDCVRGGVDADVRHLVVDLAGVTFLGSHGVAVLVRAAHATRAAGGELWVAGVGGNRSAARPLELMGLDELLQVQPDTAELVAGLASAA